MKTLNDTRAFGARRAFAALLLAWAFLVVGTQLPGQVQKAASEQIPVVDEQQAEQQTTETEPQGAETSQAEPQTAQQASTAENQQGSEPTAEPQPSGGNTAGTEEPEETVVKQSFLGWMIEASGLFGVVLLLLSFLMVALITMNLLQVRRDVLLPVEFVEAFEEKLSQKDFQGAYELAKNNDSLLARLLAVGLSKLPRGYNEALAGMQEVGEDEAMTLEHQLSYLALIGSVSPMIGLTGTVYGMIMSFQEIATSATQPKPSELAAGISTALFTTLEGLMVAIPAMVFYGILRNRVARFLLEVGMVSEGLLSRFAAGAKVKSSKKE